MRPQSVWGGGGSCGGRGYNNKEKALLLKAIASSFLERGGFLPKEEFVSIGQKRMSMSSSSSSLNNGCRVLRFPTRERKTGAALRGGRDGKSHRGRGEGTTTLFSARWVFASTEKGGGEKDDSSSLPQNAHAIVSAFANSIENATEASKILEDLSGKILENDRLYYDEAKEKISDSDYDMLRMKFEAVENRFEALKGKFGDGLDTRVGSGKASSSSSSSSSRSESFEYKKYKHLSPMKSLKNAFTEKEMREFDERVTKSLTDDEDDEDDDAFNNNTSTIRGNLEYCAELKIDGVSASLRYENGKLVRALSRGDGEFGDDITRHVMSSMCPDVPRELEGGGVGESSYPAVFEIRGEMYVKEDALESVNERKIANGETPFKNARNAAAGIMRMKEPNVDVPLSFIPHGWGSPPERGGESAFFKTQTEFYEKCQKWGFSDLCLTRSIVSSDLNALFAFHAKTSELRNTLLHKIDGIVYKINETRLRDRIGSDARAPKWAIAHKFVADVAITTLKSIEVQVGRTGVLTPVAILEPCELNGATIRRATLHNFFEIERKKIQIGQDVVVERAGDVIPKIIRVATDAERISSKEEDASLSLGTSLGSSSSSFSLNLGGASAYAAPMLCPCCNSLVSRDAEDGMVIRCNAGLKCPAQRIARASHFVSKKALDIRGLAEKQIEKLFETNAIERTSDIFTLEERFYNRNEEKLPPVWARYEKPSQKKKYEFTKNALNMFAAINDVKTNGVQLAKFIYALGIPFVGEATAKELAKTYKSLEKFKQAALRYHEIGSSIDESDDDDDGNLSLEAVEGVGDIVAKSIANFWSEPNNANEVKRILDNGVKILPVGHASSSSSSSQPTKLSNMKVCITGTFPTSRKSIQIDIERLGGSISNAVTKSTNILLVGDAPGPSKLEKAGDMGGTLIVVEGLERFQKDWLQEKDEE